MIWLWSDTLAALLIEVDRIDPRLLESWRTRPQAVRADPADNPLDLARKMLEESRLPQAT